MSAKTKKKMCWNCEGNVSIDNEVCPYCGVSLDVSPLAGTDPNLNPFTSPFKPSTSNHFSIPKAPYIAPQELMTETKDTSQSLTEEPNFILSDLQRTLIIMASLSLGSLFVIFSLVLFLFSDSSGIFTLHWTGGYWYFYLLLGAPLTYLGWRFME